MSNKQYKTKVVVWNPVVDLIDKLAHRQRRKQAERKAAKAAQERNGDEPSQPAVVSVKRIDEGNEEVERKGRVVRVTQVIEPQITETKTEVIKNADGSTTTRVTTIKRTKTTTTKD